MFEFTLLEKLNIIKSMFSSIYSIFLFLFFLILIVLTILIKRKKLLFFISTVLILIILITTSYNNLYKFIDYFIDTIFTTIYFPNFTLYTIIVITTNIIVLKNKSIINLITYYLIMFLFILAINIISTNNILLNDKISIYSNKELLSLIEATTFIFTIFLIIKLIIKKIKIKPKLIEVSKIKNPPFFINTITYQNIDIKNYKKTNNKLINLYSKTI